MEILQDVRDILAARLQIGERAARLDRDSELLGSIPELDSMAVVAVITAIEERYGFVVDDDEISAETFETLGSLADFVAEKLESG